ncbi:MAG: adenosylcobinamide-phosphate synthase CbiB, partial [Acidimicrobiales bacterium]
MTLAPLSAVIGLALDAHFGDPVNRWHPVAWFGSAMNRLEYLTYQDERNAGVIHASIGIVGATVVGGIVNVPSLWSAIAIGGKGLDARAGEVQAALERGDIEAARTRLPWLVGRNPTELDEAEIARAVVESVAENTVDAVVAPLFWASLFGARGVIAYRAVNTLDAMIGYHNERYENFGWASARLDDLLNFLPA